MGFGVEYKKKPCGACLVRDIVCRNCPYAPLFPHNLPWMFFLFQKTGSVKRLMQRLGQPREKSLRAVLRSEILRALRKFFLNPKKYEQFHEDYRSYGGPWPDHLDVPAPNSLHVPAPGLELLGDAVVAEAKNTINELENKKHVDSLLHNSQLEKALMELQNAITKEKDAKKKKKDAKKNLEQSLRKLEQAVQATRKALDDSKKTQDAYPKAQYERYEGQSDIGTSKRKAL